MMRSYPLRRMRWNADTGAIARCRRVSIAYERKHISVNVLPYICNGMDRPPADIKRLKHFIVIVSKARTTGNYATVSDHLTFHPSAFTLHPRSPFKSSGQWVCRSVVSNQWSVIEHQHRIPSPRSHSV